MPGLASFCGVTSTKNPMGAENTAPAVFAASSSHSHGAAALISSSHPTTAPAQVKAKTQHYWLKSYSVIGTPCCLPGMYLGLFILKWSFGSWFPLLWSNRVCETQGLNAEQRAFLWRNTCKETPIFSVQHNALPASFFHFRLKCSRDLQHLQGKHSAGTAMGAPFPMVPTVWPRRHCHIRRRATFIFHSYSNIISRQWQQLSGGINFYSFDFFLWSHLEPEEFWRWSYSS